MFISFSWYIREYKIAKEKKLFFWSKGMQFRPKTASLGSEGQRSKIAALHFCRKGWYDKGYMPKTQPLGLFWPHPLRFIPLVQASRSWNLQFDEAIKQFSFLKSEEKSCVYKKFSGSSLVFLVLYVDDVLLMGNDIPVLELVKEWLKSCFSLKNLGEAEYMLGIKIHRDESRRMIRLSQETYIDKVLARFNMKNSKRGFIPMSHGISLSKSHARLSLMSCEWVAYIMLRL